MTDAEAKVKAAHPRAVVGQDRRGDAWHVWLDPRTDREPIASGSTPGDAWVSAARKIDPADRAPLPGQQSLPLEE